MRRYSLLLLILYLSSCSNHNEKVVKIGEYEFVFPNDFKKVDERGQDSYIGEIKGNSFKLEFDYGYYSSKMVLTAQEYINNEANFLGNASGRFMKPGITYDNNNYPKVELLSIRKATNDDTIKFKNADFIANCKHDLVTFDFPITLPDEIKQHVVKIDTIKNHIRRITIAKDPLSGLTGINLTNLKSYNQSMNGYTSLSLIARKLTIGQQDSVLQIFSTLKFLPQK